MINCSKIFIKIDLAKGVLKSLRFLYRQEQALSILHYEIKKLKNPIKNYFLLCFSNTLLHVSDLKSENVRPLRSVNNYWILIIIWKRMCGGDLKKDARFTEGIAIYLKNIK